jgi:hypothetical protein
MCAGKSDWEAAGLSALVNKFLGDNGLRPSKDHSVYSLRHSFKDRLVAAEGSRPERGRN